MKKIMFVTGMGGIGKSTVVRKFITDNSDMFDSTVYLQYKDSVCDTMADDVQFCINGYERDDTESAEEYFIRKINAALESFIQV